jgi:hypothetical protein
MDGPFFIGAGYAGPSSVDPAWSVVATGDYNGDESADIVWWHQGSGQIAVWFMQGQTMIGGTFTAPAALPDVRWAIAGPR